MRALIIAAVFTSAVIPNTFGAEPASQLPSERQVLTYITETIDWYRQFPTTQQIGSGPADLFFVENNRGTSREIIRLSLQFGRAMVALEAPQPARDRPESRPGTPAAEVQSLLAAKWKLDANAQRGAGELESLAQARLKARAPDRSKLDAQMGEIRTRIQLLHELSANYQKLVDFVRTASADADNGTNLAALVGDLERTVPEVSVDGDPPKTSGSIADSQRAPYGIMSMISQVSDLSRKKRTIDAAADRTDALIRSSQQVREPFRRAFSQRLSTFSLDEKNLDMKRPFGRLQGGTLWKGSRCLPVLEGGRQRCRTLKEPRAPR